MSSSFPCVSMQDYQELTELPHLSGVLFNNDEDATMMNMQAMDDELFTSNYLQDTHQVCVLTTNKMSPDSSEVEMNAGSSGSSNHHQNMVNTAEEELMFDDSVHQNPQQEEEQYEGRTRRNRKRKTVEEKMSTLKMSKTNVIAEILGEPEEEVQKRFSTCKYCHLIYHSADDEKQHLNSREHILSYEAEEGTNNDLLEKEKVELGEIKLPQTCLNCNKVFKKKREYLAHYRRKHSHTKPYFCIRCHEKFFRRCDLLQHIRSHLRMNSFQCRLCPSGFNQVDKLNSHMIHDHNFPDNRVMRFKCTECDKLFITKTEVETHMKVHTGHHQFPCPQCNAAFSNKHKLQQHKRVHTNEKPFACDECDYKCRTRHALTRHQRKHTGERPYRCQYCEYAAASTSGLQRHMVKHLNDNKPFSCPYCSYKSSNMENIRKHVKKTKKHKGLMVYPCKYCSFSNDDAALYITHMRQEHGSIEEHACKLSGIFTQQQQSVTVLPRSPPQQQQNYQLTIKTKQDGKPHDDGQQEQSEGMEMTENVAQEEGTVVESSGANDGGVSATIDLSLLNAIMAIPNIQNIIDGGSLTLVVSDGNHANDDDDDGGDVAVDDDNKKDESAAPTTSGNRAEDKLEVLCGLDFLF